ELLQQQTQPAIPALMQAWQMWKRSRAMPMPFLARGAVENSESGKGWSVGNEIPVFKDGMVQNVAGPILGSLTACVVVGRVLKKLK
ncbi:unnamed protein product, partial [Polarella glacialis]